MASTAFVSLIKVFNIVTRQALKNKRVIACSVKLEKRIENLNSSKKMNKPREKNILRALREPSKSTFAFRGG